MSIIALQISLLWEYDKKILKNYLDLIEKISIGQSIEKTKDNKLNRIN